MLLAEQIVHGIFNDALHRLRIQHVSPLPSKAHGNQRNALLLRDQQRRDIFDQIHEHATSIVASLVATPHPPSMQAPPNPKQEEEETPALERIKLEKKKTTTTTKRAKRPRDTSDTNRLNQLERGQLCVPDDIAVVLAERPNRFKPVQQGTVSEATMVSEQSQQKQKQLPSKKYACVQYAPEFIEWLDRASLMIYRSPAISKAPPIFAANKEEFSLLMETSNIKMPADMRCTGCRRYFRIKNEEDNLVQKVKKLCANLFLGNLFAKSLLYLHKDHDALYRFDTRFSLHPVPSVGLDAVRVQ